VKGLRGFSVSAGELSHVYPNNEVPLTIFLLLFLTLPLCTRNNSRSRSVMESFAPIKMLRSF
jgi:hypothetical protein